MSVYTIYNDNSADEASDNHGYLNEMLDGDFKSAFPVGIDFDPGVKAALMEDGTLLQQSAAYQGLPVDMSGLPKRIRWGGGKRDLDDLQIMAGHFLVSGKLRDVIETLEPGVHQFAPVEIIWMVDDSHAADFFWFNPCNRIDGMDREHTTHEFNEKIGRWKYVEGKKYVVSLSQVDGYHVWVEKRLTSGSVFISANLKQEIEASGIAGVGFNNFKVI